MLNHAMNGSSYIFVVLFFSCGLTTHTHTNIHLYGIEKEDEKIMSVPIIHFELIISATVATTGCIDLNILTRIYGLNVRINYHGIQYLFQSNHRTEPDLHFRPHQSKTQNGKKTPTSAWYVMSVCLFVAHWWNWIHSANQIAPSVVLLGVLLKRAMDNYIPDELWRLIKMPQNVRFIRVFSITF